MGEGTPRKNSTSDGPTHSSRIPGGSENAVRLAGGIKTWLPNFIATPGINRWTRIG
jgi:hypothetical protein